jgi:hypothetical protein
MHAPHRATLAATFVALALALVAWWLFGFSSTTEDRIRVRRYRYFGRVTRIDIVVTKPGQTNHTRILYPWSEPWREGDPITSCAAIPPEVLQDRNGDGTWDTWLYRVGPDSSGQCSVEYRIDLTNDGRADWRFVSAYGQYGEADRRIHTRRNF